jgi:2-hydroxychromene-2-carboxylate isomerase
LIKLKYCVAILICLMLPLAASMAAEPPKESVDVYWSMRSPYCFIALDRLLQIREEYDVDMNLKIIWPIAIKNPEFFKGIAKYMEYRVPYQDLDTARSAAFSGVHYQYPNPDPVKQAPNFGPVLPMEQQDLIKKITYAGIYATEHGKGWEYLDQVSRMMWNGSVPKNWHKGDHLVNAINRTGLNGKQVLSEISKNPDKYHAIIDQHQKGQDKAGFAGVPLMTIRGENFFGQDRIDQLLWRMEEYRVPKRTATK